MSIQGRHGGTTNSNMPGITIHLVCTKPLPWYVQRVGDTQPRSLNPPTAAFVSTSWVVCDDGLPPHLVSILNQRIQDLQNPKRVNLVYNLVRAEWICDCVRLNRLLPFWLDEYLLMPSASMREWLVDQPSLVSSASPLLPDDFIPPEFHGWKWSSSDIDLVQRFEYSVRLRELISFCAGIKRARLDDEGDASTPLLKLAAHQLNSEQLQSIAHLGPVLRRSNAPQLARVDQVVPFTRIDLDYEEVIMDSCDDREHADEFLSSLRSSLL